MSFIIVNNTANHAVPIFSKENKNSNQTKFIDTGLNYFKQIAKDSYQRKEDFLNTKNSPNRDLLEKGIWYAHDYYDALKKSGRLLRLNGLVQQGAFFHGFTAVHDFEFVTDSSAFDGYAMYSFKVIKNVKPSAALKNLEEQYSILDCGTVCHLAYAKALCDVLTAEKFDHLFSHHTANSNPFYLSSQTISSIDCLFDRIKIKDETEVQKGDLCYFGSIEKYTHKHPIGEGRGFNVVCVDELAKKYLGLGLPAEGANAFEIEKVLHQLYNKEPLEESALTVNLWNIIFRKALYQDKDKSREYVHRLKQDHILWEDFHRESSKNDSSVKGKLALIVYRPSLERIQRLVEAPLEEIYQIYKNFQIANREIKF